jgi:hypothetical protein
MDLGIWGLRLPMMPLPEWIAGWEADLKWDVDAPKKISFLCGYMRLHFCIIFKKPWQCFDAFVIIKQAIFFVWRMNIIAV